MTDAELVSQALAGSEDAARRLVAAHQQAVFNLVCRMVRDPGVAEELAQDVFVKAFGALRRYDPAYRFTSWVLKIAQNTAIDYLRRQRPQTTSLDAVGEGPALDSMLADSDVPSPLAQAERADLARAIDTALGRLRPEYRQLVVLRYQEDLSHEEMAHLLGVPVGTVKSHLHRARRELATLLRAAGWGPAGQDPEGPSNDDATRRRTGS